MRGCCYDKTFTTTPCFYSSGNAVPITHVHVIQSAHFDAGFKYTIQEVLALHWYTHFPRARELGLAIEANQTLSRDIGLQFMTQCWILEIFFNCPPNVPALICPTQEQQTNMTDTINRDWINWHAFPFNSELELHDAGILAAGVNMCHALDDRFGKARKATLSQRDVPGTTRAAIGPLLDSNVTTISIGVNGASTPPFVPRAFIWRDTATGRQIPTLLHPFGYGGITYEDAIILPGLSHTLVVDWRGDNMGPPDNVGEIVSDFEAIRNAFPGAAVFSSTFDNFTHFLYNESVQSLLPVVTSELGDTWIHGSGSDPIRSAFFRRGSALYTACSASGDCVLTDPRISNFTSKLLKCGEHTWGLDIKTFLHDSTHWTNEELQSQLTNNNSGFITVNTSWTEQRLWCIDMAIEALADHMLAPLVSAALADLRTTSSQEPSPVALGFTPLLPGTLVSTGRWSLSFDNKGALSTLIDKDAGGEMWASPQDGTSLLWPHYLTMSSDDYANFTAGEPNGYYPLPGAAPSWYLLDFGKPNVSSANPQHFAMPATLSSLWSKASSSPGVTSFLIETTFNDVLHTYYGAPETMWMRLDVPTGTGAGGINITFELFNKTATRLPEGLFIRFNASASDGWRVTKVGAEVDPFDVVEGGNHHCHGATGVTAMSGNARLTLSSDSASLVSVGEPSALPAPVWRNSSSPDDGMSFLLVDNTWGTNCK